MIKLLVTKLTWLFISHFFSMALPLLPVSIIIFFFAYKLYQHLRYKLPPGPCPWPIIGNLHKIKPVRQRCFSEWSQIYGPIISVWFGSTLNVIISNSELAKQVLKEKDQQLAFRPRTKLVAKMSKNGKDLIWADYGPHYVKVRKVCTFELFSPKSIEAFRPIREDEVRAMIESIFKDFTSPNYNYGESSLVVRKYLGAVAFNNITRLVFGKRFETKGGEIDEQGLEFKTIVANEAKLSASLGIFQHIWWLNWISWFGGDEFSKHLERKDRLTRAIMEYHYKVDDQSKKKQSFVQALLSDHLQSKYELSEDTVIGLLWDMITAGMDTIAITVEWAIAELIKNPKVQLKVQEELDCVIGEDRVMTESDISKLPYLQCVAKEALRLHPPTPLMLPHEANADVKIGGFDIPKGTVVYVNVWSIARDPGIWRDPLEFLPERFLLEKNGDDDDDMKGRDFHLLPFGAGRRVCPAAQLSINLVTLMLGCLLHHFSWKLPDGEEIDMSESPGLVSYMKTPLQAVPSMRLSAHLYKSEDVDV